MSETDLVRTVTPRHAAKEPSPLRPPSPWWARVIQRAREMPRPRVRDLVIVSSYSMLAFLVTYRLWHHLDRLPTEIIDDRISGEWNLAWAARFLTHGGNPLLSPQMNAPLGVNMMANTSMLGLGIPTAPLTLLFGPSVSFTFLIFISLAGTASSVYWVLSRHVVTSQWAAAAGGFLVGFAPSLASHASWHPTLTAQFLIPLIVWRVACLGVGGRPVRNGLILGALVVYQMFINEEMLLFAAMGCAVFLFVYLLMRRDVARKQWRPFLKALGVTALVAGVVLAYPIYFQFFGPGSYRGIEPLIYGLRLDPASYLATGGNTLGDLYSVSQGGQQIGAEDSGSLGISLVLGFILMSIVMWRDVRVRAAVITAGVFVLLSEGPELTVFGWDTGIPGPQTLLRGLPLGDAALPARYGKVVTVLVALVLAIGLDRLRHLRLPGDAGLRNTRALTVGLSAIMLLPLVPLPLRVGRIPPEPAFITAESWRPYVGPDQSVLWLPVPAPRNWLPILWSEQHGLEPRMSHGYFHGPDLDRKAIFGAAPRPSDALIITVAQSGQVPALTESDRVLFQADLAYWNTAIILVWPDSPGAAQYKALVDGLVGGGRMVNGMWLWDVRGLTAGAATPR